LRHRAAVLPASLAQSLERAAGSSMRSTRRSKRISGPPPRRWPTCSAGACCSPRRPAFRRHGERTNAMTNGTAHGRAREIAGPPPADAPRWRYANITARLPHAHPPTECSCSPPQRRRM